MSLAYRVIARLDIKGPNLIKGVQFEGLRVLGEPAAFASRYAKGWADELLYIDTVASLYGRNQLEGLILETSSSAFIPLCVAGGIKTVPDAARIFYAGADLIAVNTGAIQNPGLITEISGINGCQAIAVSIEAKRVNGGWEAYTDGGRNPSGKDAIAWAKEAVALGAGEIIITSIDRDGTRSGPDFELLKAVHAAEIDVPVIYSGGIRLQDVVEVARYSDGMAIGTSLHYNDCTIADIKAKLAPTKTVRIDTA